MKAGADQIALPLDWPQSGNERRFILSDANREALDPELGFSLPLHDR